MRGESFSNGKTPMSYSQLLPETLRRLQTKTKPGTGYRWTAALIAEEIGYVEEPPKSASRLYALTNNSETVIRAIKFIVFAAKNGIPDLLERIAHDAGYAVSRLPDASPVQLATALRLAGNVCKTAGNAANALADALDESGEGGRRITEREYERIERECRDGINALCELRDVARRERQREEEPADVL